jgi:hypothetical protein
MAIFEQFNTFEPAGAGHSLIADVYVQPPLQCGPELGGLILKATAGRQAEGETLVITEVAVANDNQHLQVESWTGNTDTMQETFAATLDVLKNYHAALADGGITDMKRALNISDPTEV